MFVTQITPAQSVGRSVHCHIVRRACNGLHTTGCRSQIKRSADIRSEGPIFNNTSSGNQSISIRSVSTNSTRNTACKRTVGKSIGSQICAQIRCIHNNATLSFTHTRAVHTPLYVSETTNVSRAHINVRNFNKQTRLLYCTGAAGSRHKGNNSSQYSKTQRDPHLRDKTKSKYQSNTDTHNKGTKRYGSGLGRNRRENARQTYAETMAEDPLWTHFYTRALESASRGSHQGIKAYLDRAYTEEVPESIPEYGPHQGGGVVDVHSIYERDVDWESEVSRNKRAARDSNVEQNDIESSAANTRHHDTDTNVATSARGDLGNESSGAGENGSPAPSNAEAPGRKPTMKDKYTALHCILEALTCKVSERGDQTHVDVPEVLSLAKTAIETSFEMGVAPRIPHYNHLLHFCTRQEQLDFTIVQHLFFAMRKTPNLVPNGVSMSLLLTLSSRHKMFDQAWDYFKFMQSRKVKDTSLKSLTSVMNVFAEYGDEQKVVRVYKELEQREGFVPDIYVYNALIKLYTVLDNKRGVDRLFVSMDKHKVTPNGSTLTLLVKWKIQEADNYHDCLEYIDDFAKLGVRANVVVYNTMLYGLTERGEMNRATSVLKRMLAEKITPNSYSYNALLRDFAEKGEVDKAWAMFNMMKAERVAPDIVTFCHLTNAYGALISINEVENVLQTMANSPGIAMHINTIYHLTNNINPTAGLSVLRSLLDDNLKLGLKDRVRIKQFKTVLLSGLEKSRSSAQSQLVDTTLLSSILQEIEKRNISVNEEFYIAVLKYVAVRGTPEEIVRLMKEFAEIFTNTNYREYKREVFDEVIAISSSIDNGEAVLTTMPEVLGIKPTRSTLTTIHHLCVLHKNLVKAEMYREKISEHDANDPYYTLRKR